MRLVDYLALFRQRIALVLTVVAVVGITSVVLSLAQDPVYQAEVRILAQPVAGGVTTIEETVQRRGVVFNFATEAEIMKSEEVAAAVAGRLGLTTRPDALIDAITVGPLGDTAVLVVLAEAETAEGAIALANTFAEAFLEVRRGDAAESLDAEVAHQTARLQDAQRRANEADARARAAPTGSVAQADAINERDAALAEIDAIRIALTELAHRAALERGFGKVLDGADSAAAVREQSPARALVFGMLLGIPLALGAVLLLDSLHDAVRTAEDAEALTGATVLGLIPHDPALADADYVPEGSPPPPLASDVDPYSPLAEAYRTANLNLASTARQLDVDAVLMTSPLAADGKSVTTANLALAHAERARPVMLVEGDLRRPSVHDIVGAAAEPGLVEVIEGSATAKQVRQLVRPFLTLVASGRTVERPDRVLTSTDVRAVLDGLAADGRRTRNGSSDAPFVIVDGPPLLLAAEALVLVQATDAVVLVMRAGVTRRKAARRSADQIRQAGGRLLGVILVGASTSSEIGFSDAGPGLVAGIRRRLPRRETPSRAG